MVFRIFARSLSKEGPLNAEDRAYLAHMIAQRTNLSQADAERRVDQVYGQARQALDNAKIAAKNAADTASKGVPTPIVILIALFMH